MPGRPTQPEFNGPSLDKSDVRGSDRPENFLLASLFGHPQLFLEGTNTTNLGGQMIQIWWGGQLTNLVPLAGSILLQQALKKLGEGVGSKAPLLRI